MPRYRVVETSFIGDRIHEVGQEIEFGAQPGTNLEPLDGAARKAVKAAEALIAAQEEAQEIEGEEAAGLGLSPADLAVGHLSPDLG
ncbi:MAG: hypothetical protein ABWY00_00930 [Dongiaceae bacterium]